MAEHTKTPWEITDRSTYFGVRSFAKCGGGGDNRLVATCAKPHADAGANAAFIVKAVNNHDALVKALEGIAEFCSADATTLGALSRLASIRNTADQALRAVVGSVGSSGK